MILFNIASAFYHFRSLSDDIFSSLIQPTYAENIYFFERRIHLKKNRFIRSLKRLQACKSSVFHELCEIYDVLMDCSLIRFRVSDRAIFAVCEQELLFASKAMDQALTSLIRHYFSRFFKKKPAVSPQDTQGLRQAVNRLQEIDQQVLQVSASDPLAFFLFVDAFRALVDKMEAFEILAREMQ